MTRTSDLPAPSSPNGREVIVPRSRSDWRGWLADHPDRTEGVWVVYRKKSSDLDGPGYDDLLDEALCHGWIDSRGGRLDERRMIQWFSPRRRGGLWSARNKRRIEALVRAGLMAPAGQAAIDRAVADGSWVQADEVEALVVPADLATALAEAAATAAYEALADSAKRQYLWWIQSSRRPATRAARIAETVRRVKQA